MLPSVSLFIPHFHIIHPLLYPVFSLPARSQNPPRSETGGALLLRLLLQQLWVLVDVADDKLCADFPCPV